MLTTSNDGQWQFSNLSRFLGVAYFALEHGHQPRIRRQMSCCTRPPSLRRRLLEAQNVVNAWSFGLRLVELISMLDMLGMRVATKVICLQRHRLQSHSLLGQLLSTVHSVLPAKSCPPTASRFRFEGVEGVLDRSDKFIAFYIFAALADPLELAFGIESAHCSV